MILSYTLILPTPQLQTHEVTNYVTHRIFNVH